jgi:membrane-associated protease RseP (regulator of RpoE activity)
MDFYLISIAIFVVIIAAILYKDRKNVERQSILFLRRTQRGKELITKLALRFPRFWKGLGTAGVVVGFVMSVYIVFFLAQLIFINLTTDAAIPGIALVLPSPTTDAVVIPGVIGVPFWYWIIAIALLVIVHEGFHGIMSAMEKVNIKSLGWGILAIIPLAFVEPDEKDLQKRKSMTQLRVFAAGSFANFLLAGLTILIMISLFSGISIQSGVGYQALIEGYPAEKVNLTGIITNINGHEIRTIQDLSTTLDEIGPGQAITIQTFMMEEGSKKTLEFSLVTAPDPENENEGFIGILGISQVNEIRDEYKAYTELIYFTDGLLLFIFLINFGVGAANLLPIGPLDGGRMWRIALNRIIPKKSKQVFRALSFVTLFLLLFNLGFAFTGFLG